MKKLSAFLVVLAILFCSNLSGQNQLNYTFDYLAEYQIYLDTTQDVKFTRIILANSENPDYFIYFTINKDTSKVSSNLYDVKNNLSIKFKTVSNKFYAPENYKNYEMNTYHFKPADIKNKSKNNSYSWDKSKDTILLTIKHFKNNRQKVKDIPIYTQDYYFLNKTDLKSQFFTTPIIFRYTLDFEKIQNDYILLKSIGKNPRNENDFKSEKLVELKDISFSINLKNILIEQN